MADIDTLTVGFLMSKLDELPADLPVCFLAYPEKTHIQGTVHRAADGTAKCVVIGTPQELDLYQLALELGLDPSNMGMAIN